MALLVGLFAYNSGHRNTVDWVLFAGGVSFASFLAATSKLSREPAWQRYFFVTAVSIVLQGFVLELN